MSRDATVPSAETPGEPIREVHVAVTGGPSEGGSFTSTERITVGAADGNDVQLADRRASRFHLELTRAGERIRVDDLGSTNGTRVGPAHLSGASVTVPSGTEIRLGRSTLLLSDGETITRPSSPAVAPPGLVGISRGMHRIFGELPVLAGADVPVLVHGESGTGKELIARALHDLGPRASGPFVTVDCGALPASMAQSALFGHERGAYTGAERRHHGAFERAEGGTLFLDEIGELGPDHQAQLLGVLERKRFTRLGGEEEIATDVRVVSATHRDLRAAVNAASFRLDLYYRIAVVTLTVPPLRDRPEDVEPLIRHFAAAEGHDGALEDLFDRAALDELRRRPWPGNARELRNVVESALVIGRLRRDPAHAPSALGAGASATELPATFRDAKASVVATFERRFLSDLMERTGGNVREASRVARMHRGYLMELLVRHGLK